MNGSNSSTDDKTMRERIGDLLVFLKIHKLFEFINKKTNLRYQHIFGIYPYIYFDEYIANKTIHKPWLYKYFIARRYHPNSKNSVYMPGADMSIGFRIPAEYETYISDQLKKRSSLLSHTNIVEADQDRVYIRSSKPKVRWPGELSTSNTNVKDPEFETIPIHVILLPIEILNASLEINVPAVRNDIIESNIDALYEELDYLIPYGSGQGKLQGYYPKNLENPYQMVEWAKEYVTDINHDIQTEDLQKVKDSLPHEYRGTAYWIMNAETGYKVAQLRDNKGDLISIISEVDDLPKKILSLPVIYNDFMDDAVGHNSVPIILADIRASYTIGVKPNISIRRFDDSNYAERDLVLFLSRYRMGGQPTNMNAVRMLRIVIDGFVPLLKENLTQVQETPDNEQVEPVLENHEENIQTVDAVESNEAREVTLTLNNLHIEGGDTTLSEKEVSAQIARLSQSLKNNLTG